MAEYTGKDNAVRTVCIDDYDIKMCRGCASGSLGLCSVEYKKDVAGRLQEIKYFCEKVINDEKELPIPHAKNVSSGKGKDKFSCGLTKKNKVLDIKSMCGR